MANRRWLFSSLQTGSIADVTLNGDIMPSSHPITHFMAAQFHPDIKRWQTTFFLHSIWLPSDVLYPCNWHKLDIATLGTNGQMYKCINITQFPDTYTHVIHARMHIYAPTYLLIFVQIVNGHREISDFESKGDKLCHIIKSSYSYSVAKWAPVATAMSRRRAPLV